MDFTLRCNSLKCRAQLAEQAVVTTCSHIFCLRCADSLGMSKTTTIARTCPACGTHLANQDDAAITNLNPSEDYKTSILSGLNPATIIECASRAMAFWTYQTTQEVFYQEFLMKSMTEKYHSLSGQMDKLITNANAEVSNLREKIAALQIDQKDLESKNQQLADAYKKKCKDNGQLHKLYQQAKQRQVAESLAEAAEHDATTMAQSIARDFNADIQANESRSRNESSSDGFRFGNLANASRSNGFRLSQTSSNNIAGRSQIPQPINAGNSLFREAVQSRHSQRRQPTPARQPLVGLSSNSYSQVGPENFGLGTGMKFGRPKQSTPFFQPCNYAGSMHGLQ